MENKISFKPGNMLYPLPAVMVSVSDGQGKDNIFTAAWAGTVCTNPPMLSISVRPSRYSYELLEKSGEFVVNLTTESLVKETDFCGVRSGRDVDKFEFLGLTKEKADLVCAPMIAQSPVSIECRVRQWIPLGSHTMLLSDVLMVHVKKDYLDETGKFWLNNSGLMVYSHGEYFKLGKSLGKFGFSVKKKGKKRKK